VKRGKKTPASKKTTAPADKPSPAKRSPAKKRGEEGSFDDKLSQLMAGSPGNPILVDADTINELWSVPQYYLRTGSIAIDTAIGGPKPGIPGGRITEIFGENSVGKSSLLAALIAETQRAGGLPIVVDSEHKMDLSRLSTLGVNLARMPFEQVSTIEQVFDVFKHWGPKGREMLGPGVPILFAWDTVAGCPTAAEFGADTDQKFQAAAAKVLKQQFRACSQMIAQTQAAFVVTNQIYASMKQGYGSEIETYGGGAIKFHSTVRIWLRFAGQMKPPGWSETNRLPTVGQIVRATVVKNQIAPPWRTKEYGLRYKEGVDNVWSLFNELTPLGVIQQNGSWYRLNETIQAELGIETSAWQSGHFGLNEVINTHPELYGKLISLYEEKCR
jgi:recombination protein RecA